MRTLGPLYVGTLQYYHRHLLPVVEVGHTQETEIPFRSGRCLVFRMPFTKPGYYIGLFFKTVKDPHLLTDEDVDLIMMKAMRGRTAWTPNDGLYNETF
jgi:hypothetical protein